MSGEIEEIEEIVTGERVAGPMAKEGEELLTTPTRSACPGSWGVDNRDERLVSPFQTWLVSEIMANAASSINVLTERDQVMPPWWLSPSSLCQLHAGRDQSGVGRLDRERHRLGSPDGRRSGSPGVHALQLAHAP